MILESVIHKKPSSNILSFDFSFSLMIIQITKVSRKASVHSEHKNIKADFVAGIFSYI